MKKKNVRSHTVNVVSVSPQPTI